MVLVWVSLLDGDGRQGIYRGRKWRGEWNNADPMALAVDLLHSQFFVGVGARGFLSILGLYICQEGSATCTNPHVTATGAIFNAHPPLPHSLTASVPDTAPHLRARAGIFAGMIPSSDCVGGVRFRARLAFFFFRLFHFFVSRKFFLSRHHFICAFVRSLKPSRKICGFKDVSQYRII